MARRSDESLLVAADVLAAELERGIRGARFRFEADGARELGVDAPFRLVKGADRREIAFDAARELDETAEAALFFRRVDEGEKHGDASGERDAVKATLPVIRFVTRPLGREGEPETGALAKQARRFLDDVTARVTNDGDASRQAKQPAEGPAKERVFTEVVNGAADGEAHEEKEREVPVRGVRSEDDDAVRNVRRLPHQTPA